MIPLISTIIIRLISMNNRCNLVIKTYEISFHHFLLSLEIVSPKYEKTNEFMNLLRKIEINVEVS